MRHLQSHLKQQSMIELPGYFYNYINDVIVECVLNEFLNIHVYCLDRNEFHVVAILGVDLLGSGWKCWWVGEMKVTTITVFCNSNGDY